MMRCTILREYLFVNLFSQQNMESKKIFFLIFQISNSDVIEHGFWAADVPAVPARRIFFVFWNYETKCNIMQWETPAN